MKHGLRSLTAVLMAILMLICLYPVQSVFAENTAETTQAAEQTAKPKMSAAELQAQGILSVGAKGDEVTRVQQRLKDLGSLDGKVDGQYGGGTKRAVIAFQRANGLTTDGVAGQETQDRLFAEDAIAAPDDSPVDVLTGDVPILVNKDHPVPGGEFFNPADLVQLNKELSSKLVTIKYKKTRGVKAAVDALKEMLEAAKEDGIGNIVQETEEMLVKWLDTTDKQEFINIGLQLDTDSTEEEMAELTDWVAGISNEIPLHISRFFPQFKMTDREATDVGHIYRLAELAGEKLKYVYTGNC